VLKKSLWDPTYSIYSILMLSLQALQKVLFSKSIFNVNPLYFVPIANGTSTVHTISFYFGCLEVPVRVRWVNHKCKVNSDVFVRVSEETGVKILSSLA
jgi:hypothetical protein